MPSQNNGIAAVCINLWIRVHKVCSEEILQVYVGHDPSCLECLEQGFDGAIAATASVAPQHLLGIAQAFENSNSSEASRHMDELNKWSVFTPSASWQAL